MSVSEVPALEKNCCVIGNGNANLIRSHLIGLPSGFIFWECTNNVIYVD